MNDTKLRQACRNGDLDSIKSIIRENHAFYMSDRFIDTYPHPLFLCAARGHIQCFEYILKALPCPISVIYESISISAISELFSTVELLFTFFKPPTTTCNLHHPRLINAMTVCIVKQKSDMISYLLEKGVCHLSLIQTCAKVGDLNTLCKIIDKHKNPNQPHAILSENEYKKYVPDAIYTAIQNRNIAIYDFLSTILFDGSSGNNLDIGGCEVIGGCDEVIGEDDAVVLGLGLGLNADVGPVITS